MSSYYSILKDQLLQPNLNHWLELSTEAKVQYLSVIIDAVLENCKINTADSPRTLTVKTLKELDVDVEQIPLEILSTLFVLFSRVKLGYKNDA